MSRLYSYQGNEPYIFISYAHKDMDLVYPVISQMQNDGYRVWFDEGIDPGTEWDETIAESIDNSGYFLAFVSDNYIESNNCKDELKYARDLSKKSVLVYLEDVVLTRGMAMRMNRIQSIFKHCYDDEAEFYKKLYSSDGITTFTSGRSVAPQSEIVSAQSEVAVLSKIIEYDDGSRYIGEVNDQDQKHGNGMLEMANGEVYRGEFREDLYHGKGRIEYKNGDIYEGDFANGKYDGFGEKIYADGRRYKGEFLYGYFHGQGTYKLEDGSVYEGDFSLSAFHGKGVLRSPEGSVYEGEFNDNHMCGFGVLRFADGNFYEGEFKDDVFDGKGVIRFANGEIMDGTFKDGNFIS